MTCWATPPPVVRPASLTPTADFTAKNGKIVDALTANGAKGRGGYHPGRNQYSVLHHGRPIVSALPWKA